MGAPRWTRRAFVASSLPLPLLATRGQAVPSERVRFADGATEFEVHRLTNPDHTSRLPPPYCRSLSSKGAFLIYASDRAGTMQAYRMEARSGESKLTTEATKMDPDSLMLLPDEKSICFFDGPAVTVVNLGGQKDKEVYRCSGRASFAPGLSSSDDGLQIAFIVRDGAKSTLMIGSPARGGAQGALDVPPDAMLPLLRPRRGAVLYRAGDGLWLTGLDGAQNRRLKTAPGPIGEALWSPDGRTILYLSGNELREHTPDTNTDAAVAKTSQFVSFGRNADASVFVGASRSKASPYVLLLVRAARREMALCEHRCSNPAAVHPMFSPTSQRIYFQSDRSGKMAIYTMAVDKLVEKTES